jgi:hypothetical protein
VREVASENCDIGINIAGVLPATDQQSCQGFFSPLESKMNARVTRVVLVCVVGMFLGWAATPAAADLAAYEPFNGTAGEVVGQDTGGFGFTGAWTGDNLAGVIANNNTGLTYTDANGNALVQSGNSMRIMAQAGSASAARSLASSLSATGTYYVSGVFNMHTAHFGYWGIGLTGSGITGDGNADYFGECTSADQKSHWSWGNMAGDGLTVSTAALTLDSTNQSSFIVAKIVKTPGSETVTVWNNPILGDESASTTFVTKTNAVGYAWTGICTSTYDKFTTAQEYVADIRIGTTFNDVTPFTSAPEPSTMIFLGIGLFGLLCYAWRKRK